MVVFVLLRKGSGFRTVECFLQFDILRLLFVDTSLELVKTFELLPLSAELSNLAEIFALIGNLQRGRVDLLLELLDFVVNVLDGAELAASPSIPLLLDQTFDLSIITVEFLLLDRFGRFVFGLFGTDRLLIFDEGLETVVGRSRTTGASTIDFGTTSVLHILVLSRV